MVDDLLHHLSAVLAHCAPIVVEDTAGVEVQWVGGPSVGDVAAALLRSGWDVDGSQVRADGASRCTLRRRDDDVRLAASVIAALSVAGGRTGVLANWVVLMRHLNEARTFSSELHTAAVLLCDKAGSLPFDIVSAAVLLENALDDTLIDVRAAACALEGPYPPGRAIVPSGAPASAKPACLSTVGRHATR